MNEEIYQEIRKSHCARKDEEKHKCAGSCKITPKGIELSCPICGDDGPNNLGYPLEVIKRAIRICSVIGLTFENMDFTVQKKIVEEIFKDFCPNCKQMHIATKDWIRCSCGWSYSNYNGWHDPDKKV